ncbi:MAG: leucine-rich repeat protein [Clostridiales bacterium]|jgi:hypothetical protein|nr:leucine-rich repeat protein [Clostridiales bacterium]
MKKQKISVVIALAVVLIMSALTLSSCVFKYTINFDGNGATGGSQASVTVKLKKAMPTITPGFVKEGYLFTGYFYNSGAELVQYYNADGTSARNWDQSGDYKSATLYAQWEVDSRYYGELQFDPISGGYEVSIGTATNVPNIVIPATYNDQPVLRIKDNGFSGASQLKSISIPETLTSIGNAAFAHCGNLTTIELKEGNTVYSLTNGVLYNKAHTVLVAYPAAKTDTIFTVPNSVVSIEDYAFSSSKNLKEVILPNTLTDIGNGTFSSTCLEKIILPNTVTSIGDDFFSSCWLLKEITLPNTLESIGIGAFSGCNSLTEIALPNTLTNIGDSAFSGCINLEKITLPNALTSIAFNVFSHCTGLTEVTLPNTLTAIGGNAFSNCTSLAEIILPNTLESIEYSAFQDCTNLKEITLSNTALTLIGSNAFWNCISLEEVILPNTLTSIGGMAFSGCTSLEEITLPNTLISIGDGAFSGCTSLEEITIYSNVDTMGGYVFTNCNNLSLIKIYGITSIPSGWDLFWKGDCDASVQFIP